MALARNILTALALIVAALSMFFACSRNEGEIFTQNSGGTKSSERPTRILSTRVIEVGDSSCPDGGLGFDTCVDVDDNAICDAAIDDEFASQIICDSSISENCFSSEPAGSHCLAGGLKVQKFSDSDGDGECDTGEQKIGIPTYVCNSPTTMATINGAADGIIDAADAADNLAVVESPFALFDEQAYAIVPASTTSCSALADGDFDFETAPTAGDPGFVSGSAYKVCARYRIGVETKLLLSSVFLRN